MRPVLTLAVAFVLVLSAPAWAQNAPRPGWAPAGQGVAGAVFDETQRETILEFFRNQAEQAAKAEAERKAAAEKKAREAAEKAAKEAAKTGKSGATKKPRKAPAAKKSKAKAKTKAKGQALPPGPAKRDAPPQGLQQHLERDGVLPAGLKKRKFPRELDARLPRVARGLERAIVGDDVVLLEKKTRRIIDLIEGALRGGQ